MAGIKTLHYIDIKDIASLLPLGERLDVHLSQGAAWSQIFFSSATCNSEQDGNVFQHTVEATVPGKGTVSPRDLLEMYYGRYMVKVVDNNGLWWLVGDNEEGLRFTFQDTNDGTADGDTSYKLVFTGLSIWPQMQMVH